MSDRLTDLQQIFIIFSKKNHTKTHFQFVKTVGGNVVDSFSDGNTCLDRAFLFSKLIREFSTLSVAGNGLLRQVSKFFSTFMSTPMRWKNDYLLCKYLIFFSSIYNLECTGKVRQLLFRAIHWKI